MSTPLGSRGLHPGDVASFDTQAEAQRTITYLVGQGVSTDQLTLVGTGLRMVAPATQISPWRRVLLAGAGAGLICGLGLAMVMWWFLPGQKVYEVAGWCLASGVIYGVVAALVAHALTYDDDRAPVLQVAPTRYDVVADTAVAARARTLLTDAERADEGWQAIETTPPVETVDPRVWSRSAGVTEVPTSSAAPVPTTPVPAAATPPLRLPEVPQMMPPRPVLKPPVLPASLLHPTVPAHATRAMAGDTPPEESDTESTAARRYSFDL